MPLEKSEAVILKTFNWSESSRTVVFFSKREGKIALVDKGGRSFKSRRGRLIPFARLEITYYSSQKESSGYISEIELVKEFKLESDGSLGRLSYASAACELLYLLLPENQSQAELYSYHVSFLEKMNEIEKKYLPSIFVAYFLRIMSQLGYHPSLIHCTGCRKDMQVQGDDSIINLSPQRGGTVCTSCQRAGDDYIQLSSRNHRLLIALQTASLNEAATLPIGYQETMLLLEVLEKLLSYQADLKSRLESLKFLEKLKNSNLT